MDFSSASIPDVLLWAANAAVFVGLLWIAPHIPWLRLKAPGFSHVFFGACVALLILWQLRAGLPPELSFHLLGVTALTLILGWRYAAYAVALVLLGSALNGQSDWLSYGLNYLVMGAVPIAVTMGCLVWAQRYLPQHFFIYIYINAFLAGAVSILLAAGTGAGLLWLTGVQTPAWLSYSYLPYFPMLVFSEAVLNGMIMTLLVVLRPEWVSSFDDERYINGK